ncbi:putative mannitol dehydrogenase [Glycine soja]|uniref:Putative mannitol dehydrogenase n=1 Tax=Glycine soja TaxID=3848 RepID=A0A445JKX9_GLYSO|nr:putative mannitol dehydrogenase [Glycine soja]
MQLGVVGLGDLDHMAVKFAKAFGAKVTLISTSPSKKRKPFNILKLTRCNGHLGWYNRHSFCHPSSAPSVRYVEVSRETRHGWFTREASRATNLPFTCRGKDNSWVIGGIKETQEMIDFVTKHDVKPDIEIIPIDYVNTALECLLKAYVKYRFLIDIGNTLKPIS